MNDLAKLPVAMDLPPEEPGPFAPCMLLLDTSSSMLSAEPGTLSPIDELNAAVQQFAQDVRDDSLACNRADITVIEFNSSAVQIVPPTLARDFIAPHLTANGLTAMGEAIELGLEAIKARRREYRANGAQAYKPMMFLLTDGMPTDDWSSAAAEVHSLAAQGRLNFFAAGTSSADFATLAQIAPRDRPPMRVKDGCFHEMFRWISDSLSSISGSIPGENVPLPPTHGWGEAAF